MLKDGKISRYITERQLLLRRLNHMKRFEDPAFISLIPLPDGYDDAVSSPEAFLESYLGFLKSKGSGIT